jgi:aspartyl-tRNA(Asn)/glutamyl-tRNA(Gln) amidotransferase subunit C
MITKKQVEHMAKLARMELTEKEKEKFTKELSSILDYFKQLNKVDTSKVDGISQVTGLENVVREDEKIRSTKSEIRNKILKQAPNRKGDYYKVPKILE